MIELTHLKWSPLNGNYARVVNTNEINLPYSVREEVYDWCMKNKIDVEYQGTTMGTDVWKVEDEKQRLWFILRWT